jgi:hypothetical protein
VKNLLDFGMIPPVYQDEHHIRKWTELRKMYEKIGDAPWEGA